MSFPENNYRMTARTFPGLEEILTEELIALGATDTEEFPGFVKFSGDKAIMYKANLWLRCALKILVPIHTFQATNDQQLYNGIAAMEWEKLFGLDNTFAINSSIASDYFNHTLYVSQKSKDAIADRFRSKTGKRPNVDVENPDLKINIHIYDDQCIVSLDSSGEALYKRGYKQAVGVAPVNEVLAAGMIKLAGWTGKGTFADPMSGSGTLAIEAALMAKNVAPGMFRPSFGFEKWKNFDADLWKKLKDEAMKAMVSGDEAQIFASDVKNLSIKLISENAERARVKDIIKLKRCTFADFNPPETEGTLIINPPYDERIAVDDIQALYKSIGDVFKKKYAGWTCWMITSSPEGAKALGLKHTRKIKLWNGPLECRYFQYKMYSGSKKAKFNPQEEENH